MPVVYPCFFRYYRAKLRNILIRSSFVILFSRLARSLCCRRGVRWAGKIEYNKGPPQWQAFIVMLLSCVLELFGRSFCNNFKRNFYANFFVKFDSSSVFTNCFNSFNEDDFAINVVSEFFESFCNFSIAN